MKAGFCAGQRIGDIAKSRIFAEASLKEISGFWILLEGDRPQFSLKEGRSLLVSLMEIGAAAVKLAADLGAAWRAPGAAWPRT